jgi:hypothetical protein
LISRSDSRERRRDWLFIIYLSLEKSFVKVMSFIGNDRQKWEWAEGGGGVKRRWINYF